MSTHTIGQVAERTGFSASTLRYYEQHGVLEPVGRTDAGYRLYDHTSLGRLGFISRAKQLGCTLPAGEMTDRSRDWQAVLVHVTHRERTPDGASDVVAAVFGAAA